MEFRFSELQKDGFNFLLRRYLWYLKLGQPISALRCPLRREKKAIRSNYGRASTPFLAKDGRRPILACVVIYLVDPASSHMLVSKIKPCMSKYILLHSETANGSLNQLWFLRSYNPTWITVVILELIHVTKLRPSWKERVY